ncbi:mechanosensitive ion channel protein MscS [Flavobacterium sp. KMS]|uniref:mechanosensitive ion channel domain-containing protein n=1 Tax=Flavobacterium sp. KMS TaxID=1566023 RepID=UPI00057FC400|nr:mechanosensitive ion channel domain-containing protein [Flavobacterium sp. KMS]KIA97304.1 mechanosensitive ion channel protein MscS [Flavobacterium sp. KMS]KIA99349.1 mechanosensitive ion channel protein MscS [Flavobacterium sp. JRM]
MTTFFTDYAKEIFATGILIVITAAVRVTITQLVRRYAKKEHFLEHRTNLIIKYIHLLTNILFVIGLFVVWGVQTDDIFLTVSSIATVIGVAMFAQWSILSNITSGIILFFSFPFKIGDSIKIHDKDFPIEAEIEDINAFHVSLKTKEGEKIIYPNNLLLQKGISIIPAHFEDKEFFD